MSRDDPSNANDNRWSRADRLALVAIVLVAAVLRLWNLSHPPELIFDETYYAKDACWYVLHDADTCLRDGSAPEVHPPLGKWLIAIGIRIWGFDCPNPDDACSGATTSFGWRIMPALAGIASVALLYLLARRLFRSTLAASIASGLLALDFLHLVQSRTSMLDIFVPLFGIAGFLFLVYDRDQRQRDPGKSILERPWLLAAGVTFGAATATKWSGVLYLFAGAAVAIGLAVGLHRRKEPGWLPRALRAEAAPFVLYLVLAPLLLYLLTYVGRIEGNLLAWPWSQGSWIRSLWDHHNYMLDFHTQLESNHSYQSPPWTWILLKRPVSYYFCSDECGGDYQEIFAAGNPFVWWTSVLALLYVAWRWVREKGRAEGIILAGFLLTYVPWLVSDARTHRPAVFIFYLLPTIPFMCLALAYVATRIGRSWEATSSIGLFTVGTAGVFAFYLPLLIGTSLPVNGWDARIWIFDNCDKPVGATITSTIEETIEGNVTTRVVETTSDTSSVPPTGWCWI